VLLEYTTNELGNTNYLQLSLKMQYFSQCIVTSFILSVFQLETQSF